MKKKVFPSRIIPILRDNIPCGKRHAIHQKELAHRLGLRPSRIASMVQYAKKHGLFICSGNNGYWLPKDIDELERYKKYKIQIANSIIGEIKQIDTFIDGYKKSHDSSSNIKSNSPKGDKDNDSKSI